MIRVDDFDYHLPPELIAQHPPERRDGGRLMVLDRTRGAIAHAYIEELPQLLPARCLLVVNESRVIPARLWARRATGGRVEVLLVERCGGGASEASAAQGEPRPERWSCLARSSKTLRRGEEIAVEPRPGASLPPPRLRVVDAPVEGRCQIEVDDGVALAAHGAMPLPPYIRRGDEPADRDRYQTVFARAEGSIAAPTAGLHFTNELLRRIDAAGIERRAITLHVGPGTFLPVRAEDVEAHRMEAERFWIPEATAAAIARARDDRRRVVAVGTTVVRTLEATGGRAGSGRTELFITPGRPFGVVEALLTNFHLPRSTLLMLVAAFAGRERILAAYREAVNARYRFYSFGDAMLIL
jgi:S-adenosylmethionine:tRNA ribosyltransferase-isomerase